MEKAARLAKPTAVATQVTGWLVSRNSLRAFPIANVGEGRQGFALQHHLANHAHVCGGQPTPSQLPLALVVQQAQGLSQQCGAQAFEHQLGGETRFVELAADPGEQQFDPFAAQIHAIAGAL